MQSQNEPKAETGWPSIAGAAVVIGIFVAFALVASGGWGWFKTFIESAAPAWIQAIGSVAAIAAAAVIARQQMVSASRLEAKKLAQAETQKFMVIKALMVRAHGLSADICKAFETHSHEDFDQVTPSLMLDTHNALQALPVFEIPNGLLALDVLTVGRALSSLHDGWVDLRDAASSNPKTLPVKIAELGTLAEEVRDISLDAMKECNKEIAARATSATTDG